MDAQNARLDHTKKFAPVLEELLDKTLGISMSLEEHPCITGIRDGQGGFCYVITDAPYVPLVMYRYNSDPWGCDIEEIFAINVDNSWRDDNGNPIRIRDTEEAAGLVIQHIDESMNRCQWFFRNMPTKSRVQKEVFLLEKISDTLARENIELRLENEELKYRPPGVGGPGYEACREHFENAI